MMINKDEFTVFAVKAIQPWQEDADYWIPVLYDELRKGKARFGWSYSDETNLTRIKEKIEKKGWDVLSNAEKESWSHAHFMLEYVRVGDFLVYINMPGYGKCTVVKITGKYDFDKIWDPDEEGDFRHYLPCELISTFERNSNIVHPYLRRRLGLQGSWWRIYARDEFDELLDEIKVSGTGKDVKQRLEGEMNRYLDRITEELYRLFPGKTLEDLLVNVFKNMPDIINVRKGPDKNGADLEIVFETGPEFDGLHTSELCAVQVKSYEGEMGYTQAIDDIRRAFKSNSDYTCGLIVSTALKMSANFESELEKLRNETEKKIGVLLGKDLARVIIKYGIES